MNVNASYRDKAEIGSAVEVDPDARAATRDAALAASRLIAPLWPLDSFVAVNPMIGFSGVPFTDAAAELNAARGARLLMPRDYYEAALDEGRVDTGQIDAALEQLGLAGVYSADEVQAEIARGARDEAQVLPTIVDLAGEATGEDWGGIVRDRISAWAAAHFDEGQAHWRAPWRGLAPYASWLAHARLDRTFDVLGRGGMRAAFRELPETPEDALAALIEAADPPASGTTRYFHALLGSIAGWAGHARYRGWIGELNGEAPFDVMEMLAIRAAHDLAALKAFGDSGVKEAWAARRGAYSEDRADAPETCDARLVIQTALEIAYRDSTIDAMADRAERMGSAERDKKGRPAAQAVFCIDVRSERYRRALEATNGDIETFGFAGFFGFPIEVAGPTGDAGASQCPVLLEPAFLVNETASAAALQDKRVSNGVRSAWKRYKNAAVSAFAFVESWGLGFLGALARDSLKRAPAEREGLAPISIAPEARGERTAGIAPDARVGAAEGALAGMSLGRDCARLVLLVGHGSTTVNNPYASGLDCGACGGHTGEANARVAAAVLNDPDVRAALAAKGEPLPDDVVFVAALHDTTTDDVAIFDEDLIPASHKGDLERIKKDLAAAARLTRAERAPTMSVAKGAGLDAAVASRARDWSEVRPEWGLAGCAAFIAAPRERTRGVDLGGRTFLHSYVYEQDSDGAILELIMTAPLVVASWINLQYYGSTVDNRAFGSGDKTLHNVVGGLGVLEGNAGDLRGGLPLQSVHDGDKPFHEPLRLAAMIEAPIDAIETVLQKHAGVRDLFDNSWLRLIAIGAEGRQFSEYVAMGKWRTLHR